MASNGTTKMNSKAKKYTFNELMRFVGPSVLGLFLFLFPISYKGSTSTPVGALGTMITDNFSQIITVFITIVIVVSALASLIYLIFKPKILEDNKTLHHLFAEKPVSVVLKLLGALFTVMTVLKVGPELIWGADVGGMMLFLVVMLVGIFVVASFVIPLLLNFGAMDFMGTLIRGLTRPLFKLPGRSSINLLTSWIGNPNVGLILTINQHDTGKYTAKEAAIIATCFSAVDLPFVLVIINIMGLGQYFLPLYLAITLIGFLTVILMCRIPPLSRVPDVYLPGVGQQTDEIEPEGISKFQWGLQNAVETAKNAPNLLGIIKSGFATLSHILIKLVPYVMAGGVLALIVALNTPVLTWLSYPFAYYLDFLGVPEAFDAAPATIAGFIDMLLPIILGQNLVSELTRIVITGLSIVQIIFMVEIGVLILTSNIPLSFKDLAIIFIEKTVIAIPILVLAGHIIIRYF